MNALPFRFGITFGALFGALAAYEFIDAMTCHAEWMCRLVAELLATPWWMLVSVDLQSDLRVLAIGFVINTCVLFGVGYCIGMLVNKIKHHER